MLGVWGGGGERRLIPRASAPVGPGLLVLLQMMNLGFLTDLQKVVFSYASDYKQGQFGSAASANKMLRLHCEPMIIKF